MPGLDSGNDARNHCTAPGFIPLSLNAAQSTLAEEIPPRNDLVPDFPVACRSYLSVPARWVIRG
jgi:hypothetical protein